MYLRWLFYYSVVLQLVFGLAFLVLPEQVATSYGSSFDATSIALARFLGAALLPLAWISWASATTSGSPLKLAVTRTFAFVGLLDLIATWLGSQAGVMSITGAIVNYVVSGIFLIGFGYYGWMRTRDATM
jgi:hypothetical protein